MSKEAKMDAKEALGQIAVWDFIPDGWKAPLGFDQAER